MTSATELPEPTGIVSPELASLLPPKETSSIVFSQQRLSGQHIVALDGVRGIAVALVIFFHTTQIIPDNWYQKLLHSTANSCWCGVDLFFVLSGFLITGILLDAKGSTVFFRNFYARRTVRIFPLAYAFIAVCVLVIPNLPRPHGVIGEILARCDVPAQHQFWLWTYLSNFYIGLHGWTLGDPGIMWSLAIEEQFYLVWPLIVWMCTPRTLKRTAVVLFFTAFLLRVALVGWASFWWSAPPGVDWLKAWWFPESNPISPWRPNWWFGYTCTLTRIDTLIVGAFLAIKIRESGGLRSWVRGAWAVGALLLIGLCGFGYYRNQLYNQDPWVQTLGFSALAILFGAVIVVAVECRSGWFSHLLATWPLPMLGKYSYALYLFHWPVTAAVLTVYPPASFMKLHGTAIPGQLIFYAITWSVSLGAALVSWHLLEKQFLKLKRYFPQHTAREVARDADVSLESVASGRVDEVARRDAYADRKLAIPSQRQTDWITTGDVGDCALDPVSPTNIRTVDSSQAAVASSTWRITLSQYCLLCGATLLLSCVLALVISALCFWMGLGLPKLVWPCAWIATAGLVLWNPGKKLMSVSLAGRLGAVSVAAVTWIVSLWVAGSFFDITYDGQLYHQEYLLQLANGWSPFRTEFVGYRLPHYVWADHYSIGSEILASGLFKLTGSIEYGKAVHGCFIASSFYLAFAGLLAMRSMGAVLTLVLALLCALNAVSVYQSLGYYVDGDVASLIVCMAGIALVLVNGSGKHPLLLWAAVLVLIVNMKLSGLVYGGFIVALTCTVLVIQRRWKWAVQTGIVAALAIVFGTCVVGFKPYVTNTRDYQHPFYPFYGPRADLGMRRLLKDNTPVDFIERSVWESTFLSLFSKTDNAFSVNPADPTNHLKNPFTFDRQECEAITIPDVRVGGWGPLFGVAIILSFVIVMMAVPIAGRRVLWALLVLGALVFTTVTNDYGWWARYTPQLYLVPVVAIVLAVHSRSRWIWAVGLCTVGVLIANTWLIASSYVRAQLAATQSVREQMTTLAHLPSPPVVCFVEGFPSNRQRLAEMGVNYSEVVEPKLLPCSRPASFVFSPTRFCDGPK